MKYDYTYFIREGIRGIFLHGLMSSAAIGVIAASLIIMGSFSLLAINVDVTFSGFEDQNEILAYVDDTLSEADARAIEPQIKRLANVASVDFITNNAALDNFTNRLKSMERDLLEGLNENPLRHRYRITLEDIALSADTVSKIEAVPGIGKVNTRQDVADGLMSARHIINLVSITLIIVLLSVSVFIISNTIKLATFDRREEIAIMKMVGATNAFIRWPFVVEGLLLGLIGSFFAYFLQWGIYSYVTWNEDLSAAIGIIPFSELSGYVLLIFVATGFLVGVGGSALSIRKFLKV